MRETRIMSTMMIRRYVSHNNKESEPENGSEKNISENYMYFTENVYVNYLKAILRIIDTHSACYGYSVCGRTSEEVCQVYCR